MIDVSASPVPDCASGCVGRISRPAPHRTALDVGCGHGTDVIWLAYGGWRVRAVDIATTGCATHESTPKPLDADITSRIDWVQSCFAIETLAEEHSDLTSIHYVHPAGSREVLFRRLAASVAPGGPLLIVGHHPCPTASAPSELVIPEGAACQGCCSSRSGLHVDGAGQGPSVKMQRPQRSEDERS
ncbi:class I SAM-dependent methyltransferase [Rhodococcus oxybenzonivorans]|uniref:class I SAM-dependent methyltransferase n=1 Tax=Rhodococcus oxybenzonivorans TaxID=1990687 RepID=UPI000D685B09